MRAILYRVRRDLNEATDPYQTRPSDSRLALAIEGLSNVLAALLDQLHPPAPPPPPAEEEGFAIREYDEPITDFEAAGQLVAPVRGRIICGFYPFDDGEPAIGQLIRVQGKIWRIRGVERFALLREVRRGDSIGFLVGQA